MRSQSSKMEILHLMGGSYDPDTTMISGMLYSANTTMNEWQYCLH